MIRKLLGNDPVHPDLGLLLLRLGVGLSMALFHGWGKITGGPETWARVGSSMSKFGLEFAPAFWGFLAAFSEFGASLLLVVGLFFRPAAAMLAFTMFVAATVHITGPEGEPSTGWKAGSHALELLAVYVALLLTGPGRYTVLAAFRGQQEGPAGS